MGKRRPNFATSKSSSATLKNDVSRELLTDKSVALVASGEIVTSSGEDIDRQDTVARVKFHDFDTMSNTEFSGSRCDLTFYSRYEVDNFVTKSKSDPTYLNFLKSVKLIVVKQRDKVQISDIPVRNVEVRAPTFLTTATSGTLFLFDILRHLPKKVKLFGFNFYSKRQVYNPALLDFYKIDLSSHQRTSAYIANGFIAHDPRSDFLLVKNLYELSGLIDGTPEVLEILNLTADEYDARLEEMLGDW
jgi:hypothetical protein